MLKASSIEKNAKAGKGVWRVPVLNDECMKTSGTHLATARAAPFSTVAKHGRRYHRKQGISANQLIKEIISLSEGKKKLTTATIAGGNGNTPQEKKQKTNDSGTIDDIITVPTFNSFGVLLNKQQEDNEHIMEDDDSNGTTED